MITNMFYIWLLLAALLLIIQIFFFLKLMILPFALGYLAMAIVSIFRDNIVLELFAFCVITFLSFFFVRPLIIKRFFRSKRIHLGSLDGLIGSPGYVIQAITPDTNQGKVSIDREEWMASSTDGQAIDLDQMVIIDKVEGMKVYVSPIDLGKIDAEFTKKE
ncbi:NfeD family protein [bacterium]|nr:NfeD family protein [bacterium]